MSYDVTSLISERLDAIEHGAATTTGAINSFLDEFLHRGGISISLAPIKDLPIQVEPIPDLPEEINVSDLDYIPTDLTFPDHPIEEFDLNELVSEFDSISTEIGQNIDKPLISSVSQALDSISMPEIPDDLDSITEPSLEAISLPTLPSFDKVSVPYPESITTEFSPADIPSLAFIETQQLFKEFDSLLQKDLQFSRYAHELIRDRRSRIKELINFYERVLNILKTTNPLQRVEKVINEINFIVDEGEKRFISPIYERYSSFASKDVRDKLENLYYQAKILSTGQLKEKYFSENVFTDRDKEDEIESLELQLKEDLDKHETAYIDACIQVWNVTTSYVLLYVTKLLIEFQQRLNYENILVQLHEDLSKAILRYYDMYNALLQAENTQLDKFKAVLNRASMELDKIQSILEKNNAYIEAYAAQVRGLQTLVDKYNVDRRLYQAQLAERSSRVDLARSVYQNNQAKVDLYQRAVALVNKLYGLRQEKVRDILNRGRIKLGFAKAQQQLDVTVSKALENIYNIYGDIMEVDIDRYKAEYNNILNDSILDYKTKVRLNAERANLLKQAYSVFLQKVGQEDRYILTSTRLINDMANRLAMEAFRPLASMSSGLLSAIDAVVNGLYEFVAEG